MAMMKSVSYEPADRVCIPGRLMAIPKGET